MAVPSPPVRPVRRLHRSRGRRRGCATTSATTSATAAEPARRGSAALNDSVAVANIRTGATADRVSVEAELRHDRLPRLPDGWPLVTSPRCRTCCSTSCRSRTRPTRSGCSPRSPTPASRCCSRACRSRSGCRPGSSTPPDDACAPAAPNDKTVGTFTPGALDALKIVYDEDGPTSIFVHVRVHATAGGEFEIQTAVPISFEAAASPGCPCTAVHDFRLIPSPGIAPDGWSGCVIRVTPWWPRRQRPLRRPVRVPLARARHERRAAEGAAQRSSHWTATGSSAPTRSRDADRHRARARRRRRAVVFAWVIPVPRHVTVGLRRRVLDAAGSARRSTTSREAPVQRQASRATRAIDLIVESFFYRSQPFDQARRRDLGLTFSAAVVFGQNTSDPARVRRSASARTTRCGSATAGSSSTTRTRTPAQGCAGDVQQARCTSRSPAR